MQQWVLDFDHTYHDIWTEWCSNNIIIFYCSDINKSPAESRNRTNQDRIRCSGNKTDQALVVHVTMTGLYISVALWQAMWRGLYITGSTMAGYVTLTLYHGSHYGRLCDADYITGRNMAGYVTRTIPRVTLWQANLHQWYCELK